MSLLRTIARSLHASHATAHRASPLRARPAPRAAPDGFEIAAPRKLELSTLPPASSASDRAYVTGLYRELLGREPDAGGLAAHLKGLELGMSRDEIRNVFLTSPEYRQKQAAPPVTPTPATPAAPTGNPLSANITEAFPNLSLSPSSPDFTAQLRQVVAQDIQASGGRAANETDFAYWVPKMQADGEHLDYWHKRLMGWQAGGADAAKFGPYAKPSMISANIDEAFPRLSLKADAPDFIAQLREVIQTDAQASQGRDATQTDYDYWLPKMQADADHLDYWHKRLLGWQAGGADAPKYGPYAAG